MKMKFCVKVGFSRTLRTPFQSAPVLAQNLTLNSNAAPAYNYATCTEVSAWMSDRDMLAFLVVSKNVLL